MKPEIYYAMPITNCVEFVGYNLEYLYPIVDHIILTEGCILPAWDACNEQGLSIDGTTEVVRNFPDPDRKIMYIPVGRCQWMNELRNPYLDLIPPGAIYIDMDADEIICQEDLLSGIQLLLDSPEANMVTFAHYLFWKDFQHYTLGESCMRKIFRRDRAWHFDVLTYEDGTKTIGDDLVGAEWKPIQHNPPRPFLHLGWVRKPKRFFLKTLCSYRWGRDLNCKTHPEWQGMDDDDLRWEIYYNHFAFNPTLLPLDWKIEEFTGELPGPYQTHPYALHPEQIWDPQELAEIEEWVRS